MKSDCFLDRQGQKKVLLKQSFLYAMLYAVLWFPVMWLSLKWFHHGESLSSPVQLAVLVLFVHLALRLFLEPIARLHYFQSIFSDKTQVSRGAICQLQCKTFAIRMLKLAKFYGWRWNCPGSAAVLYALSAAALGYLIAYWETEERRLQWVLKCWLGLIELCAVKRALFFAWKWYIRTTKPSEVAPEQFPASHCFCGKVAQEDLKGLGVSRAVGLVCGCFHLFFWATAFGGALACLSPACRALSFILGALALQQALYRYHYFTLYLPLQTYLAFLKEREGNPHAYSESHCSLASCPVSAAPSAPESPSVP